MYKHFCMFLSLCFILLGCSSKRQLRYYCNIVDSSSGQVSDHGVKKGDVFCVPNQIMFQMNSKNFSNKEKENFYIYGINNNQFYSGHNNTRWKNYTSCMSEAFNSYNPLIILLSIPVCPISFIAPPDAEMVSKIDLKTNDFDGYFAYSDGRKIASNLTIHALHQDSLSKYIENLNFEQHEKEEKEQKEKLDQRMKKIGCNDYFKLFYPYRVLQQLSDGTLIIVHPDFTYNASIFGTPEIYLISQNKIDSSKVDDELIQDGYFQEIGIYKYKTPAGTTKTVKKLKRCL